MAKNTIWQTVIERMTAAQRDLAQDGENAIIFNTDKGRYQGWNGSEWLDLGEEHPYSNPTETDLLIVYGQSNARGYADNTPGVSSYSNDSVQVWDGSKLIPLTSYTPTADDGISTGSAWLSFGNEYAKQTGRKLVVINAGKGSQSIDDLQKGNAPYTALNTWYNDFIAYASSNEITIGERIVAFNQGEADAALQTTPASYTGDLESLWADLKNDFGVTLMGLFTVGYYADSRSKHGQVIQQAQRKFASDNDDVVLAYDNLGGFGSHNGLKTDGVHYNQRGYNIMGREGAINVANALFNDVNAPSTDPLIKRFGGIGLNQSQAWNLHSAVLEKTATEWNANHSDDRASSLILGAEELSDRVRVKLSCPATTVLNAFVQLNGDLQAGGMRAAIGNNKTWANTIASSTDADGYAYVDIFFYIDLYARVNMVSETTDVAAMGTAFGDILNQLSVNYHSTGRVDITHPDTKGLAQGSIMGSTGRTLRVNAGVNTTILQLRDGSGSLVDDTVSLVLPNILVSPANIKETTNIAVQIISADFGTW